MYIAFIVRSILLSARSWQPVLVVEEAGVPVFIFMFNVTFNNISAKPVLVVEVTAEPVFIFMFNSTFS